CCGIEPDTLGNLHACFPKQDIGYFGMGLNDDHARALVQAANLQNITTYNANSNSFTAEGLTLLLNNLPALKHIELSHGDLTTDKLLAVAQVRKNGGLQQVRSLNVWKGKPEEFTPEALVALVEAFADL